MLKWLGLSVLIVIIDQATKIWADNNLSWGQIIPVMPYFDLTLAYNTGAAFSFLAHASGWQRWLFIGIGIVASIAILIWLRKLPREDWLTAMALSLVLGGAVGNIIDRILYGHVIDFIHWYYEDWHWPAFNIADAAITVGAALLIITALFTQQDEEKAKTN